MEGIQCEASSGKVFFDSVFNPIDNLVNLYDLYGCFLGRSWIVWRNAPTNNDVFVDNPP